MLQVSVREAGVDYLCRALIYHAADVLVIRPAVECLAFVVRQHATFVDVMLRSGNKIIISKECTVTCRSRCMFSRHT